MTNIALTNIRRKIARTDAAGVAAFPVRLACVSRHNARQIGLSATWLMKSKEHTNLTYDLTTLNRSYLAWFVANLSGVSVTEVRRLFAELEGDESLRNHIRDVTLASPRYALADPTARYGRRLGWYALARITRPAHIVETGTDKGLGSCVLAAALLKNGHGHLTTIDINPEAGYLLRRSYGEVGEIVVGDSVEILHGLDRGVDMFIHDSNHDRAFEEREFEAVMQHLGPRPLVMSDNSDLSTVLMEWAERRAMTFHYFDEEPLNHWHPGGGIGAAVLPGSRWSDGT